MRSAYAPVLRPCRACLLRPAVRAARAQCVQDIGSLRWGSEQQPTVQPRRQWGDQDCFATCTSRDAEAPVEQKQRAAHVSGNDAAAVPDTNHRRNHDGGWGHGARGRAPADGAGVPAAAAAAAAAAAPTHSHMQAAPAVQQHQEAAPASAQSKAEQLRQWSCQQLEDLLAMIRCACVALGRGWCAWRGRQRTHVFLNNPNQPHNTRAQERANIGAGAVRQGGPA
jgi:hypothetical protein